MFERKSGEGCCCRSSIDSPDFAALVDLSPATPQRGWVWFFLSDRIPSFRRRRREGRASEARPGE
nr:hypothetical protein [uncultured Mucilaginibacter sp.]